MIDDYNGYRKYKDDNDTDDDVFTKDIDEYVKLSVSLAVIILASIIAILLFGKPVYSNINNGPSYESKAILSEDNDEQPDVVIKH